MESNRFNGKKIFNTKGSRLPIFEVKGNKILEYMGSEAVYEIRGNSIYSTSASGQASFEIRGSQIYEYMSTTQPLYEIR